MFIVEFVLDFETHVSQSLDWTGLAIVELLLRKS